MTEEQRMMLECVRENLKERGIELSDEVLIAVAEEVVSYYEDLAGSWSL